MSTTIRRLLLSAISFIFGIATTLSLVFIFINSSRYFHVAPFNIGGVLFFVLLLSLFFFMFYKIALKYRLFDTNERLKYMLIFIGSIVIVYQLIFVSYTYMRIGWDTAIIVDQASGAEARVRYFMQYPNNVFLTFIYKCILQLSPLDVWHTLAIFNVFIVDTAVIITCLCSYRLQGKRGVLLTVVFALLTIVFSPYLIVPYTDTMSMLFPPLLLLLLINYIKSTSQKGKLLNAFFFGSLLIVGYRIKPTIIILLIAATIIYFLTSFSKKQLKNQLTLFTCLMLLLGSGLTLALQKPMQRAIIPGTHTAKEYDDAEYPLTHFMMMGLWDGPNGKFGGYNHVDDMGTYFVVGKSKKTNYHREVIKNRVGNFGFVGLMRHFFDKYIWSTTDGSFFYGGEGQIYAYLEPTDSGLRGLFQHITNWEGQFYRNIINNFQQAVWCLILLGCIFSTLWKDTNKTKDKSKTFDYVAVMTLSLLGLSLFLILFEARSRYLMPYIPFYLLLASQGYLQCLDKQKNKKQSTQ